MAICGILLVLLVSYPVIRYTYYKYYKIKGSGLISFISGYPHDNTEFEYNIGEKQISLTDILDQRTIHNQICENLNLCKDNTIIAIKRNNNPSSYLYANHKEYNDNGDEITLQNRFILKSHSVIISEISSLFELNEYDLKIAHGWVGGCVSKDGEIFHYKQHKYEQRYHDTPAVYGYDFVFDMYIIKLDNIDISHHTVFLFEDINTSCIEYILPEKKK